MKSIIRYGLLALALICFSNIGFAQKKNKKKAKTTVSSIKKKKSIKKTSSRKKQTIKNGGTRHRHSRYCIRCCQKNGYI